MVTRPMNGLEKIVVKPPAEYAEEELRDFEALVLAGGEVSPNGLFARIKEAEFLATLKIGDCLAGVAALKNPKASYRRSVSENSGVALSANLFPIELGWIFVMPSARGGRAIQLMDALMPNVAIWGVFATARVDNVWMHKSLRKFGFRRAGTPYPGRKQGETMIVFVRSAV